MFKVKSLLVLLVFPFLSACSGDLEEYVLTTELGDLPYDIKVIKHHGGKQCPESLENRPEDSRCAIVELSYPVFRYNGTQEQLSNVSKQLNSFVAEEMLQFESETGEQAKEIKDIAQLFINDFTSQEETFNDWGLERHMTVEYHNDKLLSLSFAENYFAGGTHPVAGVSYYVIDLLNGEQLNLSHLLASGFEGELNVTGERLFRQSRDISNNVSLEDQGFVFKQGIFQLNNNFAVTASGLRFYFNSYEIAPYAMGPSIVEIPYEDIRNLIPVNSPIAR